MHIVVYADESGIHDRTGQKSGSGVTVVGGYFGWVDDWVVFSDKWTAVLKEFSAQYFHYTEVSAASSVLRGKREIQKNDEGNPFLTWKLDKIDQFILSLAKVIATSPVYSIGGFTNTLKFHNTPNKPTVPWSENPTIEDRWMYYFCGSMLTQINRQMPHLKSPITMFFDRTTDSEWRNAIGRAHAFCESQDSRIKQLAYANKKDPPHTPLQAADMYVYRSRQITENLSLGKFSKHSEEMRKIDSVLFKKEFAEFQRDFPDLSSLAGIDDE